MPAIQLQDMVAALKAANVSNYDSVTLPGRAHGLSNWRFVKDDAISFQKDHF